MIVSIFSIFEEKVLSAHFGKIVGSGEPVDASNLPVELNRLTSHVSGVIRQNIWKIIQLRLCRLYRQVESVKQWLYIDKILV